MVKKGENRAALSLALFFAAVFCSAQFCAAQEMAVPIKTQFSLLPKILSLEKNVSTRLKNELAIGIVYQRNNRASLTVKENIFNLPEFDVVDCAAPVKVNLIPIEYSNFISLAAEITKLKLHVLYVTPLRSVDISKIAELSRQQQILSFTGVPEYVQEGITAGIGAKNGKPQILINITGAKAEGMNFSSKLLNLSKIIE